MNANVGAARGMVSGPTIMSNTMQADKTGSSSMIAENLSYQPMPLDWRSDQ